MARPNPPAGYHSLTPYLIVADPVAAFDFYARAFGAKPSMRLTMPGADGKETIAHAEMIVGDSHFMFSGEWPDMDALGPLTRGGATTSFLIYVPDVDAAFARAVEAGAEVVKPVELQFYGDRSGTVRDPFGHMWTIATNVEEVSEAEGQRRMDAMASE